MSKTIVLTGASDGIGAEAARTLAADGHQVIIVGRTPEKTRAVAAQTSSDSYTADFADLSQVRQLAQDLQIRYPRIDVLANNAGGLFNTAQQTVDGHDTTFQVNHLAPFLLTNVLLDTLKESPATVIQTARVVAKRNGNLNLDDLENRRDYSPIQAYSNAKLENILRERSAAMIGLATN